MHIVCSTYSLYESELWGIYDLKDIDKYDLGVKIQTPN